MNLFENSLLENMCITGSSSGWILTVAKTFGGQGSANGRLVGETLFCIRKYLNKRKK